MSGKTRYAEFELRESMLTKNGGGQAAPDE